MTIPAPYPPDTRAKGWRFELDMERARQSDTWTLASPDVRPWLLLMWATAWEQTPCGSMPADDELIAARLGMPPKLFAKHRAILMRRWWLAEDGRYYHDVLVQRVTEMLEYRAKGAKRVADYKARMRDQRSGNALPPSEPPRSNDTGTGTGSKPMPVDLQDTHRAHEESATHGEVTRDSQRTPAEVEFAATKAGAIGQALKRGGIDPMQINLSDPMLAALIEQGATPDEFEGLAKDAISRGIDRPYAWVLAVLPKKRAAAAKLSLAAPAAAPPPNTQVQATEAQLAAHRAHMAETASPEARQRAAAALAQARKAITRGAAA